MKKLLARTLWIFIFFVGGIAFSVGEPVINVMAPLFIGDPANDAYLQTLMDHQPTPFEYDWSRFRTDLNTLRERGITSISVDVWWGVVQRRGADVFDWSYYRRLFETIRSAGLKIKAILSTHSCGLNVGDNVRVPIPSWVWERVSPENPSESTFESEAGNRSHEYVSFWATERALPLYENFWSSFMGEFRDIAPSFSSVSISMGASGELHFPSYHAHDAAFRESHYPNRGLFQGSGPLALEDYHQYLKRRYKTIDEINQAWGTRYRSLNRVFFPQRLQPKDFNTRIYGDWIRSPEAEALFDWYHESLLKHLRIMLTGAAHSFWRDPDFGQLPISVKIPGVHWEENRYAELMNGLISLRDIKNSQAGKWDPQFPTSDLGYGSIFQVISQVGSEFPDRRFEVYSTAGSTPDSRDPFSRAQSIIRAQAVAAQVFNVPLKLENALAGDLYNAARLDILTENLQMTGRHGITLLRMNDVIGNETVLSRCGDWLKAKKTKEAAKTN